MSTGLFRKRRAVRSIRSGWYFKTRRSQASTGSWLRSRSRLGVYRIARHAQQLLIEKRIETKIQRRLSLDEAVDGLMQYIDHMTDGKVLITP
jgi:hypothetical protein